ncbi:hypothetical protein [Enterovibrio baiacu]|uniref:hypothetical protein n=1 Tax=Enterovibrio baiacu TaxID=2491023 RepID=UPI003D0F5DE0
MFRETLSDTFKCIGNHKKRIFQITFAPVTAGLALDSIPVELSTGWLNLVETLVRTFLLTIIAVNVHRIVLLGSDSVPKWGRVKIGKTERRFFLHFLAILLLSFSSFLFLPWLGYLITLFELTLVILACRLSLVFPAIAIGQADTFSLAWYKTEQKTWYMFGIVFAVPLLTILLTIFSSVLEPPVLPFRIISYLVFIYEVVAISLAYRKLNAQYEEKKANQALS